MATPAVNSTTYAAYLQRMYSPTVITNTVTQKQSRAMKLCKAPTNGAGSKYVFLSDCDDAATGSASYEDAIVVAQANTTSAMSAQYEFDWSELNCPIRVSGRVLAQSRNNTAAWMSAIDRAVKSATNFAGHLLSIFFWGQGWGELSQGTIVVSGSTFTLSKPSDIHKFARNMLLHFTAPTTSMHSNGLRSATGLRVSGVDYDTATVTCAATLASVSAVTGDYVFAYGFREDSATPTRRCPVGMDGWFPVDRTDAANKTIGGVDRSLNSRQFGYKVDGTTGSIKSAIKKACQVASSFGNIDGSPVCVLSPNKFSDLSDEMDDNDRTNVTELKGRAGFGIKAPVVYCDGIEVAVISDKYRNDDAGLVFNPAVVEIVSMGPLPRPDDDDGRHLMKISDTRGIEARYVGDYTIAVKDPSQGVRINF